MEGNFFFLRPATPFSTFFLFRSSSSSGAWGNEKSSLWPSQRACARFSISPSMKLGGRRINRGCWGVKVFSFLCFFFFSVGVAFSFSSLVVLNLSLFFYAGGLNSKPRMRRTVCKIKRRGRNETGKNCVDSGEREKNFFFLIIINSGPVRS